MNLYLVKNKNNIQGYFDSYELAENYCNAFSCDSNIEQIELNKHIVDGIAYKVQFHKNELYYIEQADSFDFTNERVYKFLNYEKKEIIAVEIFANSIENAVIIAKGLIDKKGGLLN